MPEITHDGKKYRAKAHRLASEKPAYVYQWLYIVPKPQIMYWQGEFQSGMKTEWFEIPTHEHDVWNRRKERDRAVPEPQLMSEWSEKAGRPADIAIYYQNTIQIAQRYWKGKRIQN